MSEIERYAITLPGCEGPHTPATVVIVRRTEMHGPGHQPVYADETGSFRVLISGDAAQPLSGTDSHGHRCLYAFPLPEPAHHRR